MRSKLLGDVEWYLKLKGGLDAAEMGVGKKRSPEPERKELLARLQARERESGRLLWVTVSAYLLLLAGGFILVFLQRERPDTLKPLLGGAFLSLLAVGNALRGLWREKSALDLLLEVAPSLSSDQLVPLLQAFYFKERGANK